MTRRRFYIVVFLVLGFHFTKAQQTGLYTNFLQNPYIYNPAYAGVIPGTQLNIASRSQWLGFEGAPKTVLASGWGNLRKHPEMALGGLVGSDRAGLIVNTTFLGSYAYRLKVNKKYSVNFGLSFGGVQYNVKMYDARPYDQDDYFMSNQILRSFAFDANAGLHLYSNEFFFGLSTQHMLNSRIRWEKTSGRLTPHYYVYAGYNYRVSKDSDWVVQPTILVRTGPPAPFQVEGHLKVIYKDMIWVGGSLRQKASFSFLMGCKIKKALSLAYAYDFTTTRLNNYSSGSQEISLSYLFPFKRKKTAAEQAQDADEGELNTIDNSLKTNLKNKKKAEQEKKEGEEKKEDETKPENPEEKNQDNKEEKPQGE